MHGNPTSQFCKPEFQTTGNFYFHVGNICLAAICVPDYTKLGVLINPILNISQKFFKMDSRESIFQ